MIICLTSERARRLDEVWQHEFQIFFMLKDDNPTRLGLWRELFASFSPPPPARPPAKKSFITLEYLPACTTSSSESPPAAAKHFSM